MRDCFIHIGTHKTGTTTLQRLLNTHPEELAAHGFHYPRQGRSPRMVDAHHNIAWEMNGEPIFLREQGDIDALAAEVGETEQGIVISSEHLSCCVYHEERFRAFCERLRQADLRPTFIIVLRDQIGFAESLYSQLLSRGVTVPFGEFCDRILRDGRITIAETTFQLHQGERTYPFDYAAFTTLLEDISGAKVIPISYNHPRTKSPVGDFFALLGIDAEALRIDEAQRLNTRHKLAGLGEEFAKGHLGSRRLNRVERAALRRRLKAIETQNPRMSRERQSMFIERFGESNREMSRRYGLPEFEGMRRDRLPAEESATLDDVFSPKIVDSAKADPAAYLRYFLSAFARRLPGPAR